MSQLSGQIIQALCEAPGAHAPQRKSERLPLVSPFLKEKLIINGASAGLSSASYDIRIGHDLELGPNPAAVLYQMIHASSTGLMALEHTFEIIRTKQPYMALACSMETFAIPRDMTAYVVDKSTYARKFTSAFNTLFDPGFVGVATLELVNLGGETLYLKAGDPICQIAFHWLDQPAIQPYDGKYQDQPARPVGARFELDNGKFNEAGIYPHD